MVLTAHQREANRGFREVTGEYEMTQMTDTTGLKAPFLPAEENELSRRYLRMIEKWIPVGIEYFQEWPDRPDCGHFFGGCHWYGNETAPPVETFALASVSPEYDEKGLAYPGTTFSAWPLWDCAIFVSHTTPGRRIACGPAREWGGRRSVEPSGGNEGWGSSRKASAATGSRCWRGYACCCGTGSTTKRG